MAGKVTLETYERILTFIHDYKTTQGKSPLQREIGAAVGLSGRTIQLCLEQLVREGKIRHYPCMPRGIEFEDRPWLR